MILFYEKEERIPLWFYKRAQMKDLGFKKVNKEGFLRGKVGQVRKNPQIWIWSHISNDVLNLKFLVPYSPIFNQDSWLFNFVFNRSKDNELRGIFLFNYSLISLQECLFNAEIFDLRAFDMYISQFIWFFFKNLLTSSLIVFFIK